MRLVDHWKFYNNENNEGCKFRENEYFASVNLPGSSAGSSEGSVKEEPLEYALLFFLLASGRVGEKEDTVE